jgi:hypothetical protein
MGMKMISKYKIYSNIPEPKTTKQEEMAIVAKYYTEKTAQKAKKTVSTFQHVVRNARETV